MCYAQSSLCEVRFSETTTSWLSIVPTRFKAVQVSLCFLLTMCLRISHFHSRLSFFSSSTEVNLVFLYWYIQGHNENISFLIVSVLMQKATNARIRSSYSSLCECIDNKRNALSLLVLKCLSSLSTTRRVFELVSNNYTVKQRKTLIKEHTHCVRDNH